MLPEEAPVDADVVVVGGGIVGLAVAWQVQQSSPGARVVVLEKEDGLAQHQSGRSSGVLHTGVYYTPGSIKARTCLAGREAMERFCTEYGLPWRRLGKVIVAVNDTELGRLSELERRGHANGVQVERVGAGMLKRIEPHVAGVGALHVPNAGVADFRAVAETFASMIRTGGGEIRLQTTVRGAVRDGSTVVVESEGGELRTRVMVNCAGLHNDRLAVATGVSPDTRIVPFRGEYWSLTAEATHLCRGLIYPVPDPALPFLGVHLTRGLDEGVSLGPNAVLAFAREGYTRGTLSPRDLMDTLMWPGFWRMAATHWRSGVAELMRSASRTAFAAAARRLVPAIEDHHLEPAPAGVRAQAVRRDGGLEQDFVLHREAGFVHVLNAPSPAATASLEVGRMVAEAVVEQLNGS